ncbi:hypothetical protein I4641_23155 [Waterburya agarophytonicola K14]|uniref:Uncharacterized protein n=1 Tax=Waterburya agarophytonicola KI4 TaxID=2874699 RepID=A0A964C1N0_9CYAN|nr:hypothetical protein [Waterburya agarophytonicola]MCC0179840.1 hypothetical protein [Waterburya agarophytonicola KI4]
MSDLNEIKCKLEELKNLNARGEEWEYFQVLDSIAGNVYRYNDFIEFEPLII